MLLRTFQIEKKQRQNWFGTGYSPASNISEALIYSSSSSQSIKYVSYYFQFIAKPKKSRGFLWKWQILVTVCSTSGISLKRNHFMVKHSSKNVCLQDCRQEDKRTKPLSLQEYLFLQAYKHCSYIPVFVYDHIFQVQ